MEPGTFTRLFAIKRAYHIPAQAPPKILHQMIARILHFCDRENILRAARSCPEMEFNGCRISIYPDFYVTTKKQRASFQQVKKHL